MKNDMNQHKEMAKILDTVVGALAVNTGISMLDAAKQILAVARSEAAKLEEQEKMGTMSYDPRMDPAHPMHGWKPE